ncbi:MAG TPA: nuclear transport factor 2 family protein [Steroidobacteraceae bacterium]|nr:nuclear transport factor 2 family protein [Steroidobacteraceae bacterium]
MKSVLRALIAFSCLLAGSAWSADDLAARLTAVQDRQAIDQLVLGDYPRALDEQRLRDYAALFTSDGQLVLPGLATLKGPDAIYKFLSTPGVFDAAPAPGAPRRPPSPLPKPYEIPHITSSPSYKVTGTTASGGAYWTEVRMVDGKPQVIGSGHYVDELRKVNGQWKFAKRTILRDVPPPAPPAAPPAAAKP